MSRSVGPQPLLDGDGATVGGDESGNVDGVAGRVLAQRQLRIAVDVAARVRAGADNAGDARAQHLPGRPAAAPCRPTRPSMRRGGSSWSAPARTRPCPCQPALRKRKRCRRAALAVLHRLFHGDVGGGRRQQLHTLAQSGSELFRRPNVRRRWRRDGRGVAAATAAPRASPPERRALARRTEMAADGRGGSAPGGAACTVIGDRGRLVDGSGRLGVRCYCDGRLRRRAVAACDRCRGAALSPGAAPRDRQKRQRHHPRERHGGHPRGHPAQRFVDGRDRRHAHLLVDNSQEAVRVPLPQPRQRARRKWDCILSAQA